METINKKLLGKCGIYLITNVVNGKRYIGSSKDLYERLYNHIWKLNSNIHHNIHLQRSWNKHGQEMFEYGILEFCEENSRLIREGYYIEALHPEYNLDEVNLSGLTSKSEESKIKASNSVRESWENKDRQKHCKSRNTSCFVYSIKDWSLVLENVSPKEVSDFLGLKVVLNNQCIDNRICSGEYVILSKKYDNVVELKNYVCFNLLKYSSKNLKEDKYLIVEKDGERYYFKTIQKLLDFIGCSSKSSISSHQNATIDNPYIPKNTNIKIYFSKEFIKYVAVPNEES